MATAAQLMHLHEMVFLNQMKPHFIFNAINPLQSYILKDKKEEALDYLNKLVKLLREVLRKTDTPYMPLAQKINFLETYIQIQQARFGNNFTYAIKVSANVDTSIKIPAFLLQPLVENAIEHGIQNLTKGGYLNLSIFYTNDKKAICAVVENNGGTLPNGNFIKEQHALQIIINKIKLLKNQKGVGSIEFANDELNNKVSIKIELPIIT